MFKSIEILKEQLPDIVTRLAAPRANDLLYLIKNRIQTKGEKATGGKFSPYSTNTIKVSSNIFTSKTAIERGIKEKSIIPTKSGLLVIGGYRKLRELEGRQVVYKDFTRTGMTMRNIQARAANINKRVSILFIGNDDAERIMSDNAKREGIEILEPNSKEIEALSEALINDLEKEIINYFK